MPSAHCSASASPDSASPRSAEEGLTLLAATHVAVSPKPLLSTLSLSPRHSLAAHPLEPHPLATHRHPPPFTTSRSSPLLPTMPPAAPPPLAPTKPKPQHWDIQRAVRKNILALAPYRCARDDYDQGILLDANENALGHALPAANGDSSVTDSESPCVPSLASPVPPCSPSLSTPRAQPRSTTSTCTATRPRPTTTSSSACAN